MRELPHARLITAADLGSRPLCDGRAQCAGSRRQNPAWNPSPGESALLESSHRPRLWEAQCKSAPSLRRLRTARGPAGSDSHRPARFLEEVAFFEGKLRNQEDKLSGGSGNRLPGAPAETAGGGGRPRTSLPSRPETWANETRARCRAEGRGMILGILKPWPGRGKGRCPGSPGKDGAETGPDCLRPEALPRWAAAQCLPFGLPSPGLALRGPSRGNSGRLVSGGKQTHESPGSSHASLGQS